MSLTLKYSSRLASWTGPRTDWVVVEQGHSKSFWHLGQLARSCLGELLLSIKKACSEQVQGEFKASPAKFFYPLSISPLREADLQHCVWNSRSKQILICWGCWGYLWVGQLVTVQESTGLKPGFAFTIAFSTWKWPITGCVHQWPTLSLSCLSQQMEQGSVWYICDHCAGVYSFFLSNLACTKLAVHTATAQWD